MPINVSEAIDSDTAEKILVERTLPGAYVDGHYVSGAKSTFKTLASVQQPTPKQLQMLTENERDMDLKLFIPLRLVNTASDRDGTPSDVITYKGIKYTIIKSGDWISYGYSWVIGARVQ